MNKDEWLDRFANLLGLDKPSADEMKDLLDLAGIAAHSSERPAAPLACYLLGRSGAKPAAGLALAKEIGSGPPPD